MVFNAGVGRSDEITAEQTAFTHWGRPSSMMQMQTMVLAVLTYRPVSGNGSAVVGRHQPQGETMNFRATTTITPAGIICQSTKDQHGRRDQQLVGNRGP